MRALLFSFLVLILLFPVVCAESSIPQEDFVLYGGRMRVFGDPKDMSQEAVAARSIFSLVEITVKDGKVTAGQTVPVQYTDYLGMHYSGSGTLHMDGTFDKDTGAMKGKYTLTVDVVQSKRDEYEWQGKTTFTNYKRGTTVTYTGSYSTQLVTSEGARPYCTVLTFLGTGQGTWWEKRDSNDVNAEKTDEKGNVENSKLNNLVAFTSIRPYKEPEQVPTTTIKSYEGIDSGARIAGLTGQCDIQMPGWPPDKWRPCKMEEIIPVDAHIKTEEDSAVILSFVDMSTFVMKAESEIVLSSPPEKDSKIRLVAGNIWANVKHMWKYGTMDTEMDLNQAVLGTKGTTFVAEEKDGKSTLKVIEGNVSFKSKKTGQTIMVTGGQQVSADMNNMGQLAQFDIQQEIESWSQLNKIDWAKIDKEGQQPQQQAGGQKPEKTSTSCIPLLTGVIALLTAAITKKI